MPRKYVRKVGASPRAGWTEDALREAFEEMRQNKHGLNENISSLWNSCQDPEKTFRKHPALDFDNEKRLVAHIQKLEAAGFPVSRDTVRSLAFQFAEKLGIGHKFNKETGKAGPHWLKSFLERQPTLSVRQAEGLSLARAQGLNREEVQGRPRVASEETDSSGTNDSDESFKENESHVDVKQKNVKRAKKLKINETSSVNVIQRPIRAVEKKQRITKKNASERKAIASSESDSNENSSNEWHLSHKPNHHYGI
ncbi:unnamed protein product [Danaus chrysippus]|uniref:(African queen) hypothetical protein n=1 Tax=Danaus chrysippus TaxID=151541 RepID=A0A8J2QXQ4_9NEOP|nr:unnamed protein product [Danaus chrysippus]